MLKYALVVLGTVFLADQAQAQAQAISRYNSTSMSCSEARARIAAEGAVIMRWRSRNNPNLPRYDRYVANDNFCPFGQSAVYDHIPTADTGACRVRRCEVIEPDLFDTPFLRLRRH